MHLIHTFLMTFHQKSKGHAHIFDEISSKSYEFWWNFIKIVWILIKNVGMTIRFLMKCHQNCMNFHQFYEIWWKFIQFSRNFIKIQHCKGSIGFHLFSISSKVGSVPYRTVTGTAKNRYGFSLPYRYGTSNGTDQYGPGTVTKNRTKNRTGTAAVPKQCLDDI